MLIKPNRPFSARISSLPFKTFFLLSSSFDSIRCAAGWVIWLVVILRVRTRTPLFNASDAQYGKFSSHTNEPAYVCVCRLAIVPLGFPIIICFHCTECVAYSSFAHVRTAPQLGDFRVVLCFVTFSPFLSLNSSLADNPVVFRSVRVCVVLASFTLSKLAFNRNQIDSGE